jgi:ferredoxin
MRALIEMVKHDSFSLDNLLTICIDCLKTIAESDYQWRKDRKISSGSLTQEVLQFARQGGVVAYRYRSACQMCISPQAQGADINISVLGLPVRDQIIIGTDNEDMAELLSLSGITEAPAAPELIKQHAHVVAKMDAWHYNRMKQVTDSLDDIMPKDIAGLMMQLESCAPCEICLDVCPICAIDHPTKDTQGHYDSEDITRWLLSCAGCGMCEQACPSHYPLNSIFRRMREELCQTWDYVPGISIENSLPLV